MFRTLILIIAISVYGLPSEPLLGQSEASSLAAAKEISQATGRPIFAIAGRST